MDVSRESLYASNRLPDNSYWSTATPQTFNASDLAFDVTYNYTRADGLISSYYGYAYIPTAPSIFQFGGEKQTYDSAPTIFSMFCSFR